MGYTLMPREEAIARSGDLHEQVRAATSYFFDSRRNESLEQGEPTHLVPVGPSVILLDDDAELDRVATAIDGLFIATMMNVNPYRYANATNFVQLHQTVAGGRPGNMLRQFRTLFGSKSLATEADYSIETRPPWCGEYGGHDSTVLQLFETVAEHDGAGPLRRCIRALYAAMSDADSTDRDLEHANYARALERLLQRDDQTRHNRRSRQNDVANDLIERVLNRQSRLVEPGNTRQLFTPVENGIIAKMTWVRDERNAAWHPEDIHDGPLRDQTAVRPNLVAFRVISALIIAVMAELNSGELPAKLASYVAACEHWLEDLDGLLHLKAEDALSRFGSLWAMYLIRTRG